jgi:hypothetical protein
VWAIIQELLGEQINEDKFCGARITSGKIKKMRTEFYLEYTKEIDNSGDMCRSKWDGPINPVHEFSDTEPLNMLRSWELDRIQ